MPDQTNNTHIEVPSHKPQPTLLTETNAFVGLIVGIAALFTILYKLFGFGRDVEDLKKQSTTLTSNKDFEKLEHKLNNQVLRIDMLERQDNGKEVRLVKLEADVQHIREGQDRMEEKLDRYFSQLAESIREIRNVKPKE